MLILGEGRLSTLSGHSLCSRADGQRTKLARIEGW
jgi:hypothetical protein